MQDVDRILGALQEFKEQTKDRLESIEKSLDEIQHLRWQIMGGATVISVLITAIFEYIIGKKG